MEAVDESSFLKDSIPSNEQQTDQFSCSGEENEDDEDDLEEEVDDDDTGYSNGINLQLEDDEFKSDTNDESQNIIIDPLTTQSSLFASVTSDGTVLAGAGSSAAALQMTMPLAALTPNLGSGQELVIISPNGGIMKLPENLQIKPAIPPFPTMKDEDTDTKRLIMEQDGQTYILTLPGGINTTGLDLTQPSPPAVITTPEMPLLLNQEDEDSNSPLGAGAGGQSDINQAWFTSREDKSNLQSKGHVWKQGMWSKEEIDLLESNIFNYCEERGVSDPALVIFEMTKDERKDFYRSVAKGLNRPLFSVYRRVIRMYDNKNHVGKYTSEELEKLKKLRSTYGNNWQAIGSALGRSASSIKDRCRLMKDNCNQGKWLPEEERRLAEAVYELAQAVPGEMISSGLSWALVAERVGTRSEKQCRTKWLNYLNWKEAQGTEWTREDDITLICRVYGLDATEESHVDWNELSKNWPSVRSPQWLRSKWWALKRHVPTSKILSFQDICEYLFRNQVQKVHIKDEDLGVATTPLPSVTAARALPMTLIRRNSPVGIGRELDIPCSATALAAQSAVIPTIAPGLTSLLGNLGGVPAASSPLVAAPGTAPLLQTLEVLGTSHQGLHIAPNPGGHQTTFLLTQPTIPLTTAHGQIIIQTLTPEESMSVQLTNPAATQLIISNGCHPLTSLADTEVSLAATLAGSPCPDSPSPVQDMELQISHSQHPSHQIALLDHVSYVHHHNHGIEEEEKTLIMDDPMLAASNSPDMLTADLESRDGSKS